MEKNKVKIHRFPKIDFDYVLSLSPGYYETTMINKVIKLLLHTVKNHSFFFNVTSKELFDLQGAT